MLNKKSFTLIELLIVIIIIGILAAISLPGLEGSKERALDKEAKTTLVLIQAAEKIYRMETGDYYPLPAGPETSISNINTNLKLSIPTNSSWNYEVNSSLETASATRNKASGRTLELGFGSETITCTPNGDTCY